MKKSINHPVTGIIAGLVTPVLAFWIFCLIEQEGSPMLEVLKMYKDRGVLTHVISLSVLGNLPVFFAFLQTRNERAAQGVIGATIAWAIYVFAIKLL